MVDVKGEQKQILNKIIEEKFDFVIDQTTNESFFIKLAN